MPPASLLEALRALIVAHAGKPCPPRVLIAQMLGVNPEAVREALRLLEAAGELDVYRTAFIGGLRKRMRVKVDGAWSAWTALTKRRIFELRLDPDRFLEGDAHHLAKVLRAGRYG